MSDSWFNGITVAPPIEVFNLSHRFQKDSFADKVNLGVGAYRTNEGKPWVLPVVRKAETQMAADETLNHEYLPVAGLPDYVRNAAQLLLGENSPAVTENRYGGIQAIGGTGALRIGMDFLKKHLGCDTIYVSNPTWGNHKGIAKSLGYKSIVDYRYWDGQNRKVDIDGYLADLEAAPAKSVVVLHMCAHNPTGMDPSADEWARLAEVIRRKQLFPFFDCAYQGFASGNLDSDASALRYFIDQGFEVFAAQSFSKNFGLYNERVGNLVYVCKDSAKVEAMKSQLELVVRTTWSNSPSHGARIVATVIGNPGLCEEWKANVKTMAERIISMRQALLNKIRDLGTPGTWDHIIKQSGMFSYLGINEAQVAHIISKYHIYLLKSGRINMCALTTHNVEYVAKAIHEAVTEIK